MNRYAVRLLLIQLNSKARIHLDISSKAIHIQASTPLIITVLSSTIAVLALPRWKASDRLPNLCTQFIMDLLLRLRKGLKALETFQELKPERYRYTEYATIPRGVLSLLKSSLDMSLQEG